MKKALKKYQIIKKKKKNTIEQNIKKIVIQF